MSRDLETNTYINQSFPTDFSKINENLPISLKFVIYGNWYYTANGWSVLIFFVLMRFKFNSPIPLVFYIVMAFPMVLLNILTVIITSNLLRKSNIVLSMFLLLLYSFFFDLIHGLRISSSLGVIIPTEGLYPLMMVLLILSMSMTVSQLILLIFSNSLKIYYLNKQIYIKPQILRNFVSFSILGGIPLGLLYAYYFSNLI